MRPASEEMACTGVEHHGAVCLEQSTDGEGRADQGVDGVSLDESMRDACGLECHGLLSQLAHLPVSDRQGQLTGGLEVARDAEAFDVADQTGKVLGTEPTEQWHLVGPTGSAIAISVGQRGRAEPTVATGGIVRQSGSFEHEHRCTGVGLQGSQRRPQAGEAAADHHRVDRGARAQRGSGRRPSRVIEPEGSRCRRLPAGHRAHHVWPMRSRSALVQKPGSTAPPAA